MLEAAFTFDQAFAYFTARLPRERIQAREAVAVHCCFHEDRNPSLSLNLAHGLWNCHGCNLSGGIVDFERRLMGSDAETAWKEIDRICGRVAPKRDAGRRLVKTYDYTDVRGRLLFQKLRYEPKHFSQRQPDGKGGWTYNLNGAKKVLYRLPEVLTRKFTCVVEGEKDADNLQAALGNDWACTTNFDGAGANKWKEEYSPYLAGRFVLIVPDNDDIGSRHAENVAESVAKYADRVKIVRIPDLPEHGDISWWLAQGHVGEEFLEMARTAPLWQPQTAEHVLLDEIRDFLDDVPAELDWLIEGVIPEGANGILVADPKVGKSLLAIYLALSLASTAPFLGHAVPKRRRVALVSREDHPGETARRLKSLQAGDAARSDYQWGQIWLNTRQQSERFLLDNGDDVTQLIAELKMERVDLCIMDVFRRLHMADENDNTAMARVMDALNHIQAAVGCSIALVHHPKKEASDNVFRDLRGASAIHGWTEWGMGLTVCDETQPRSQWVRKLDFELKAACPPDPLYFTFSGANEALRVERTEKPKRESAVKSRGVANIAGRTTWHDRED